MPPAFGFVFALPSCTCTLNTVAKERQRVGGERRGGRGIKYEIVSIEYRIEIIWVRKKWI
jgi:hypothetical protein